MLDKQRNLPPLKQLHVEEVIGSQPRTEPVAKAFYEQVIAVL